jgi:hypothetical protein
MTDIVQKYFVPIGVILTFMASIISIYFTRKNVKTSKYIDTITSERIKWIEKVRTEIADLLAEMQEYLRLRYLIVSKNIQFDFDKQKDIEVLIEEFHKINETSELEREISKISKVDLIKKLQTLKLRLNCSDDKEIIDILDFYILIVSQECDRQQSINGWDKLSRLVELTQIMLKKEWEKVKNETLK